jgi:hypothetical protein
VFVSKIKDDRRGIVRGMEKIYGKQLRGDECEKWNLLQFTKAYAAGAVGTENRQVLRLPSFSVNFPIFGSRTIQKFLKIRPAAVCSNGYTIDGLILWFFHS